MEEKKEVEEVEEEEAGVEEKKQLEEVEEEEVVELEVVQAVLAKSLMTLARPIVHAKGATSRACQASVVSAWVLRRGGSP